MREVVGLAEMRVSSDPEVDLVTYALGSCLGLALYDPVSRVGGLAHLMLPVSTSDPARAEANPCLFVDTGVPQLFHACYRAGAQKGRLSVRAAGGASLLPDEEDLFQIGKRNVVMLRRLLWRNGVLLQGLDVGGHTSRTMTLAIGTGAVTIRSGSESRSL